MSQQFDNPEINDNRKYNYENFPTLDRVEYQIISGWVEPDSSVIDLGCGNGSLLEKLIKEKNVKGHGMELSRSGVETCIKKGLSVIEGKIDEPLPFSNQQFDYAICNVTLQMVMFPEVLINEMKRVARYQVISFPNFAFWRNRYDLLMNGRMPTPMLFGYTWYSTGHIHQLSNADFKKTASHFKMKIIKSETIHKTGNPMVLFLVRQFSEFVFNGKCVLVRKYLIMSLVDEILSREEFKLDPPVLIDIGASGSVHAKWKKIAKYSVCVSFDADERELGYLVKESTNFRKQIVYNCIVSDKKSDGSDFYLTRSPYCSATLEPDIEKLNDYSFAELFEVEKKISIKAIDLPSVISEHRLTKIDWFKTDSQGTDLRLFRSIGPGMIEKVLVAEFEPGLIDAYKGEDKLHTLLAYMDVDSFWLSSMTVKGSQRIRRATKNSKLKKFSEKILRAMIKTSPGWAEVVYFNSLKKEVLFSKRDYLLAWVFASVQKQHGFALDIALKGKELFKDQVFENMEKQSYRRIISGLINFPFYAVVKIKEKFFG